MAISKRTKARDYLYGRYLDGRNWRKHGRLPLKNWKKEWRTAFFPPLVFSFVSLFLLHCAFSPFSPVVNVARNELDSPSARPSRLFFFFDKWRGINKRLPVRLAIFYDPLHTYVYICVDACLCIGLPASIRYTHTTYIYIFSHFPLALTPPSTSLPGTLLFLF